MYENQLGEIKKWTNEELLEIEALRQAVRLRPDAVEIAFNLANALGAAGRHEERLAVMRDGRVAAPVAAVVRAAGLRPVRADARCFGSPIPAPPGVNTTRRSSGGTV